ncbi:MAG: hypothetical protein FE834_01230, partial [Gammaproteobacteria bacterium]|nr:hypothetical protein [Gammaproteobacteria bacterium]
IVEALKLKNTDVDIQAGIRTATISYIDANGSAGSAATASLKVEINRGFAMNGETANDRSGYSVSNAGDVNGDGLDDLIVGAPYAHANRSGKTYVIFGKTDTNVINLSAIAGGGTGGFIIDGGLFYDQNGASVSSAGDVNGDGLDDLIVGVPYANNNTGSSYVVFGKANNTAVDIKAIASSGTGGFVIRGEHRGDYSGWSVSSAGDVNGDGLDDLIIGTEFFSSNKDAGRTYVVFGKADNTAINLSAIASGTGGFIINGEEAKDHSGFSVSSAGDVNGDGLDDLIVGAYNANSGGGKSYVVFGKTDNTAVNLSDIASGTGGFVINGTHQSNWSVSSAGDVNGDGLDDLIVSAPYTDNKSYVVFGKKGDTDAINLSVIAQGTGGFVINGEKANDHSGYSVSSAGDVNGDGLDDLIVGAYSGDPSNVSDAGKSYVVFGKTNTTAINLSDIAQGTGGFVINGEKANDHSGFSVSSAGDVNGDGLDDLIVGAYCANGDKGKSYVIFGKTDTNAINLSRLGDDSKYTIDKHGTTGDDDLIGDDTNKDEIFVAGAGNDTLTGNGGMDVFSAGSGSDTIIINASNITALEQTGAGNRANINGGGNVDTLKLDGSGLTLDFTKISNNRIKDIEKIDLTGSGDNILKLNLNDILDASTSTNILKVFGNSGDKVDININKWTDSSADKTEGSVTYKVYTHADVNAGANAALWIDTDLTVI